MSKAGRKTSRKTAPQAAVSTDALAALVGRLRDLPAAAGPDAVKEAVGELVDAVPIAAGELGRTGDDASIAGLAALLTVPAFAVPAVEALGRVRDEAAVHLLLRVAAAPPTHRQLDKEWPVFLDERPVTLAQEISFPYAQSLLAEAAGRMTDAGQDVPDEYTAWLEFTGGQTDGVAPALIYGEAGIDPNSPPNITPAQAISLLGEPEIELWTLPFAVTLRYATELLSTRDSPIVLSESAGVDRERQLVHRAADELFTSELRQQYRRRLEETALLFHRSDRSDQATAALVTALALGDAAVPPSDIPFAQALTLRALEAAGEITPPAASEGEAPSALLSRLPGD